MPRSDSQRGLKSNQRGGSSRRKASSRPVRSALHVRRTLELRDGRLRLVVVADTHGQPHPACGALTAARKPDYILHAGDIGDLAVLDELASIAPVLAVRGNIDAPVASIPEALTIEFTGDGRALLKVLVVHIGVYGPKLRGDVAELARSEGASMVICGHSHVPFIGVDKGLGIFNPGSVGPRRFQLPIVFGVLDIERKGFRLHHVDCETGETWLP